MHVALAKTSNHDVNTYGSEFPVTLRLIQLSSIQTLVNDITQCVTELSNGQ